MIAAPAHGERGDEIEPAAVFIGRAVLSAAEWARGEVGHGDFHLVVLNPGHGDPDRGAPRAGV
ncbi:hypothetical protein [Streptomyces filamentosus]|uniref:hypothetical protein n=1 Tax=Streptomyces filamentosus TaxID=67294 RepID=UPI0033341179